MGIASFTGASSVVKPGVVTTATRPSSPFVGQLIYDTDISDILAWNGSAWTVQSGGLVYLTGASFTSATTISMAAGVFTSTYKTYQVVFQVTSGNDSQISVRVNNAGTPRTATNYYGYSTRSAHTGVTATATNAGTSLNLTAMSAGNGYFAQFTGYVFSPTIAERTQMVFMGNGSNDSNTPAYFTAGGEYNIAEATDGLTFICGAAQTGFYRVYGLTEN